MSEDYVKSYTLTKMFLRHLATGGRSAPTDQTFWHSATYSSSLSGVKLPSWKRRVRDGVSATTRLVGSKYAILDYTPGRHDLVWRNQIWPNWYTEYDYKEGIWLYYSDFYSFPGLPSAGESQADNVAKAKFVKYARQAQSTFAVGVSGGELRETLRFIRSPLRGLHRGLRDYMELVKKRARERRYIKRRNLDKKVRETILNRMVAGTWLEAQLAINPLMGEVKSGAEALARIVTKVERERVPIKGTGRVEGYVKLGNPAGGWSSYYKILSEDKTYVEVTYKGAVRVTMPEKHRIRSKLEILGLMPRDFLPTVWELIPGSFLMDYVYNIDDIISASTYSLANFAWVQKTVRKGAERTVTMLYDQKGKHVSLNLTNPGEGVLVDSFSTPRSVLLRTSVVRDVYTGSLVPDLTVNVPSSAKKWANIAGLLLVQKRVINALR